VELVRQIPAALAEVGKSPLALLGLSVGAMSTVLVLLFRPSKDWLRLVAFFGYVVGTLILLGSFSLSYDKAPTDQMPSAPSWKLERAIIESELLAPLEVEFERRSRTEHWSEFFSAFDSKLGQIKGRLSPEATSRALEITRTGRKIFERNPRVESWQDAGRYVREQLERSSSSPPALSQTLFVPARRLAAINRPAGTLAPQQRSSSSPWGRSNPAMKQTVAFGGRSLLP
jgi:hypothetical protein